jgi:succinate dehydrogenase / fumarate reductase flavoprotein subunit
MFPRKEMLDLVIIDGKARGIITRNLITGEIERHGAHAVVLATGGYGTIYYLSTLAVNSNASAAGKHIRRCILCKSMLVQIHRLCAPWNEFQSKLTLMSESLRNDGRVWVPAKKDDKRPPNDSRKMKGIIFLKEDIPHSESRSERCASRAAKERCDAGYGVGDTRLAVYLDFRDAIEKQVKNRSRTIMLIFLICIRPLQVATYEEPKRIYPAGQYTMGGLWVDYELMTTIPVYLPLVNQTFRIMAPTALEPAHLCRQQAT